jgi:4-hydroxybenzoate polyprenyltransferase
MKVDQLHPEKLIRRPLAAEKIRPSFAVIISIILGFFSIILSLLLSYTFGLAVILLFVVFLLYSLFLKHISIIDIHVLALGHVIRAASGALLIGVFISPWMLTFVFLLALFLAVGKRRADLSLLKNAQAHKKVYKVYTRQLLDRLSVILLGLMLLVYILYVVINHYSLIMLITIPLGSVIIFRYLYFISTNHVIARRTELIFKDKICILFFILWFIFCFVGLYLI